MKKFNSFTILTFSSILVFVSLECNRDNSPELIEYGRYTDKYLGSWDFRYISKTTNSTTGEESTDTVFFTGVINTGTGNGGLVIQYTEQLNMSLRVGYDGVMIDKCMQPTSCHGEFTGDNVFHYNLTSRVFTGQSFVYYNKTIDGKKISGESSLNKAPLNGIGDSGNWWTSSGDTGKPGSDSRSALAYCLFNNGSTIVVLYGARRTGYSVRCIKNR